AEAACTWRSAPDRWPPRARRSAPNPARPAGGAGTRGHLGARWLRHTAPLRADSVSQAALRRNRPPPHTRADTRAERVASLQVLFGAAQAIVQYHTGLERKVHWPPQELIVLSGLHGPLGGEAVVFARLLP